MSVVRGTIKSVDKDGKVLKVEDDETDDEGVLPRSKNKYSCLLQTSKQLSLLLL